MNRTIQKIVMSIRSCQAVKSPRYSSVCEYENEPVKFFTLFRELLCPECTGIKTFLFVPRLFDYLLFDLFLGYTV